MQSATLSQKERASQILDGEQWVRWTSTEKDHYMIIIWSKGHYMLLSAYKSAMPSYFERPNSKLGLTNGSKGMQHLLVYLKHKNLCSALASLGLSTPQSTQTLFPRITSNCFRLCNAIFRGCISIHPCVSVVGEQLQQCVCPPELSCTQDSTSRMVLFILHYLFPFSFEEVGPNP